MSSSNLFSLEIQGLKELQDSLNLNRINKEIAVGIGLASRSLVSTLRSEILNRYNISASKFDAALQGQSSSNQVTGRNIILNSIQFKDTEVNLAKFVTNVVKGNIDPLPKQREGRVHSVTVKKGRQVISYGKHGFGGFIPIGHNFMVERTGPGRNAPLRSMYAPSVVDMVNWTLDNNTKVQQVFETFSNNIFDNIVI